MDYIFYHGSDLDGACSGAIMDRYCHNARMYAWEYNYPFPEDFHPTKEDTVYFVDCSTNPYDRITELAKLTNVIMIDHHKTFIEFAEKNIPEETRSHWVLDTSKSGCMLCWEYAFPNTPMPRAVWLLGNYDIWNRTDEERWQNLIMPFQMGMRGTKVDSPIWEELFSNNDQSAFYSIMERGGFVYDYMMASNASAVRKHAFETTFEGYKALACNTHNFSSQTYESLWDANKYDLMFSYCHSKGKEYWVSLYTTKPGMDVSGLAVKYGGGGHPQAAGFTVKTLEVKNGEIKVTV